MSRARPPPTMPCRPSCRARRPGRWPPARIGQQSGHPNLIGCDMGGTSFDVTPDPRRRAALIAEKDIAYGVPIRVPMIDIHTIGAGGGSIARITKAGILQVGPESAGANPGPDLLWPRRHRPDRHRRQPGAGHARSRRMPGVDGEVPIDRSSSLQAAIVEKIGRRWASTPSRRRRRHHPIVSNHLASAIRLVSIEKGYDPRDFALFAVRRRRPAACRGAGARARRADGAGAALPGPHLGAGLHPGRPPARFRAHAQPAAGRGRGRGDGRSLADEAEGRAMIEAEEACRSTACRSSRGRPALSRAEPRDARAGRGRFDPATVMASSPRYKERFDIELTEMRAPSSQPAHRVLGLRPKIGMDLFAPKAVASGAGPRTRRPVHFGGQVHDTPLAPARGARSACHAPGRQSGRAAGCAGPSTACDRLGGHHYASAAGRARGARVGRCSTRISVSSMSKRAL